MNARTAIFLAAIASTSACTDDDWTIIITTTSMSGGSNDTSVTTLATNTMPMDSDATGEQPTTEGLDLTTSLGASETSGPDDTTGPATDDTSGGPIADPPIGCAHFVEINGAQSVTTNYIMIDSSACLRGQVMDLTITLPEFGEFSFNLGPVNGCATWGGNKSPAAADPNGTVIAYPSPDSPPKGYWLTLSVDGAPSDDARIPAILHGQEWDNAPDAPNTPVRRAADFSWGVIPEHVIGCEL